MEVASITGAGSVEDSILSDITTNSISLDALDSSSHPIVDLRTSCSTLVYLF